MPPALPLDRDELQHTLSTVARNDFITPLAVRPSHPSVLATTSKINSSTIDLTETDEEGTDSSDEPSHRAKTRRLSYDSIRSSTESDTKKRSHSQYEITSKRTLAPSVGPSRAADAVPIIPIVPVKRGRGRPRKYPIGSQPPAKPRPPPAALQQRSSSSWRVNIGESEAWMRRHLSTQFVQQLMKWPGPSLTVINTADEEEPPRNFTFISEYVFREGTARIDEAARYGCKCRVQNGRDVGCEYTYCECIEDAGDESEKLGFPYHAVNEKQGCLRNKYLATRHMIYECNELCNCPPHCKNKVVQKGRQIPLDIFKTRTRGWGLRCPEDLRKGQFVDVYLGEVITDAEARRREKSSNIQKNSYLFALDKFQEATSRASDESDSDSLIEDEDEPDPNLFVVDGEHMGGPTRFINHSCNPNLRIFTVSLVRGDSRVYELAFFAIDEVKAGTELTFDYMDHERDGEEEGQVEGKVKCLCGAENCRGWLWI